MLFPGGCGIRETVTAEKELKRTLGLPALMFFGLGAILGAGIYSVVGAAAGVAGPALWQSFLCAAVIALLSALSYAELATMYAEPSAEYAYLRHALPRWHWPAFAVGVLMAASSAATTATVSLAFAGYAGPFIPGAGPWLAAVLVALVVAISVWGIRESAWMAILFTLFEAGGLVLVVVVGMGSGRIAEPLSTPPTLALSGCRYRSGASRCYRQSAPPPAWRSPRAWICHRSAWWPASCW